MQITQKDYYFVHKLSPLPFNLKIFEIFHIQKYINLATPI